MQNGLHNPELVMRVYACTCEHPMCSCVHYRGRGYFCYACGGYREERLNTRTCAETSRLTEVRV